MLEAPVSAPMAGLQATVVAACVLTLGYLISDALLGRRVDAVTHWGLSFVGVCLFALALMLVHIATGGRVFSSLWTVPLTSAAAFVGLGARKLLLLRSRREFRRPGTQGLIALGLVVLALVVWGSPVVRNIPIDSGSDIPLHTGWASQLLNGETTPSAFITGEIPNFYPWLSHSLMALLARLLPEGRALHAMAPLQLVQVMGIVLALFALGKALTDRTTTAAAAALFGALTGGFGFFALREVDLVTDPRSDDALRYFGDLLHRRGYNVSFSQLAPAYPRDIALVLLVGSLLLLAVALRSRPGRTRLFASSGVALGMAGLTGAESFYLGFGAAFLLCLVPHEVPRGTRAGLVLLPALAVAGLWFGPQLVTLARLGYQNITVLSPIELPPATVLISWGVTTPFAVWGMIRCTSRLRIDIGVQIPYVLTVVGLVAVLGSSLLPVILGEAFDSIGRSHRYWPLLHLGVTLFAALGATQVALTIGSRRSSALAVTAATIALALPSPTVASLALPDAAPSNPLVSSALRGRPGILFYLSPAARGRCVVAVAPGRSLPSAIWSYSGYRFVYFRRQAPPGNPARIRWDGIYEATIPVLQRRIDNERLTMGWRDDDSWREAAERYGVDLVVAPLKAADSPVFDGFRPHYPPDAPVAVYRLSDCGT